VLRFEPSIAELLSALDCKADSAALSAITVWVDQVARWNEKMDMTAARNDAELVDLMVADAAQLSLVLPPSQTVVDVGSGAGAPGLPLALLRPDLHVLLAEPMQKRAALLRMTIGKLGIAERVAVEQKRGGQLTRTFDVALSRATLAPPAWLELGAGLAPDGEVCVLLAREPAPGLEGWASFYDERYCWPLTGASRRLVRFRQQQP
jgi:16S rRNA (guanine527-N7)-methyltransferase